MKKLLWISFSIVLFLSGISHIKAETILETTSNKSGSVELKLNFEEGYVGAIDLTLKVSSNIKVTNVSWDSSIPVSYTKRYTYDEVNHIVKIYLATGNNTRNLVDKNGVANIGSLIVTSTSGGDTDYTVDITALSIVDANYTTIAKNDMKINGNNQFTYKVDNTVITEPNQSENNPSGNNSNQTNRPNFSNQTVTPEKEPSEENNNEDNSSNQLEENDKKEENSTQNENKKPTTTEKKPEVKKGLSWKITFGIVIIAMLLITLLSMIFKKFKD